MSNIVKSPNLKSNNFDAVKTTTKNLYGDNVKFKEHMRPDNKKLLNVSIPDPLGVSFRLEDGRFEILDKMSPEQMKQFSHYLYMLGVRDIVFPPTEDQNFAEEFNTAFYKYESEEIEGHEKVFIPPLKYEDDKGKGIETYQQMSPAAKAKVPLLRWAGAIGKFQGHNCKIKDKIDGGFEIKFYPNAKAMKESGKYDAKSGEFSAQGWDFYLRVTPKKINGNNSLHFGYATAEGKDISGNQASELLGAAKQAGITHMRLDMNVSDNDKLELLKAGAKQGVLVVTNYNNKQVTEMLNDNNNAVNLSNEVKIAFQTRLMTQIKENLAVQGKTPDKNPEMDLQLLAIEKSIKKIKNTASASTIRKFYGFTDSSGFYERKIKPKLKQANEEGDAITIIANAKAFAQILREFSDPEVSGSLESGAIWDKKFDKYVEEFKAKTSADMIKDAQFDPSAKGYELAEKHTTNAREFMSDAIAYIKDEYSIDISRPSIQQGSYKNPHNSEDSYKKEQKTPKKQNLYKAQNTK